jgi:hypothetical protein
MKSRLLTAALAVFFGCAAEAQTYQDAGGTIVPGFVPIQPGVGPLFTSSNPAHVSGSFSASLSGFQPSSSTAVGTPFSAQTTVTAGSTQSLPSGTVVVATNAGATNTAYCQLGPTASTSSQPIAPNGGWFAFTVGSATQITCVTATSTTTVNTYGGAGLPTGTGGGGGGGSSGVAQGSTTSGQTGSLTQGAVTTLAPSYTTAQTSPLSLDTSGNLRVNIQASVSAAATGSAVPSGASYVGAVSGGATPTAGGLLTGIIQADHSAPISISTATTTQLVAASGSTNIYVTGWDVISSGADNFQLEYGTGTNCGTGTTALTGLYNLAAQAGVARGGNLGVVYKLPAGAALCAVTTAATQMSGSVSYTQF